MRRCPVTPLLLLAGALVLAVPVPAWAQPSPETDVLAEALAPPVYAAHVDGPVTVSRDGASLVLDLNAPLLDGDRVRTAPTSRVELAAPGWGHVFLDQRSTLDLPRADRLRLVDGRARLDLNDTAGEALRVDTPAAGILPTGSGSYLIEVVIGDSGDEVTLTVVEGSAEFQTDRGALTVRSGECARARGMGAPELGRAPEPGAEDAFAAYVDQRLAEYGAATEAPETLPEEIAAYSATLSRNGQWEVDASYGAVWYPAVAADWQPYGDGRWDRVGHYGWFWVGATAWSWPTHHYGRWGVNGSRWFWVPDRTWAPSWVSWAVGPGYVGWCALGRDDRPVVPFGTHGPSATYTRGRTSVGEDRWRGWHLVDREGFESRAPVSHVVVNPRALPHNVAASFVTQRVPPVFVRHGSLAVPRTSLPMSRELANQTVLRRGPTPARDTAEPRVGPDPVSGESPYERARPYMARPSVRHRPPASDGQADATAAPPEAPDQPPGGRRPESDAWTRGAAQPRTTRQYSVPAAPSRRQPQASSPEPPATAAPPPGGRGTSPVGASIPSSRDSSGRTSPAGARGERGSPPPSTVQGGQRSDSGGRSRVPSRPPR